MPWGGRGGEFALSKNFPGGGWSGLELTDTLFDCLVLVFIDPLCLNPKTNYQLFNMIIGFGYKDARAPIR